MDPLIEPAVAVAVPLVLALLVGHWNARRAWIASGLLVVGLGLGAHYGAVALEARGAGGPWDNLWMVLVWVEFTLLIRWAGGFPLRGPLGPLAFLGGALIGEIGATLLLSPRAGSRSNAARVALTASAGALISPLGSPVTLLVLEPGQLGWGLPVALALLSWPRGWAQDDPLRPVLPLTSNGINRNLGVVAFTLAALVLGPSPLWALFAGCMALMILNIRTQGKPPSSWGVQIWIASVAGLVFLSQSSGAFWEIKEGINLLFENAPIFYDGLAVLAGAVVSVIATEEAGAMLVSSLADTGLHELNSTALAALGAGMAVGGLGPLLLSGAFIAGLRIWMLQIGVVVFWFTVLH